MSNFLLYYCNIGRRPTGDVCLIKKDANKFGNVIYSSYLCSKKNKKRMNKKIYILTCVDGNGDLMAIKSYRTETQARADMEGQYEDEKKKAESLGYTIDDYFSGVEGKTAGILYGDFQLKWAVSEVYNPYEGTESTDSLKSEFLEQVYFEVKADTDDDSVMRLNQPVGDYDAFYFDEGNETIQVWNRKKRNYTSIFSMDIDEAYAVAVKLHNHEYEQEV